MLKPTCALLLTFLSPSLAKMEGFIVGGKFGSIDRHPHSAFLSIHCVSDRGVSSSWICGASIVNQIMFLTAAHCLYGCTYESHIGLKLGNEDRKKGQTYMTHSFIIHEDYNPMTSLNDICIIRTETQVLFSNKASRVALMRRPPYAEKATVAGWGMTDEILETQSEQLKVVSQTVWNRNDCLELFRAVPKGTICAASDNPNEYAARGDSGSALIVRGYIQIGLVSYKMPYTSNHVVLYTDVGFFYDWIRYYTQILSCI